MGTSYTLLRKQGAHIALDEASCRFSLSMSAKAENGVPIYVETFGTSDGPEDEERWTLGETTTILTAADLVTMAAAIVQVASYFHDGDEEGTIEQLAEELRKRNLPVDIRSGV